MRRLFAIASIAAGLALPLLAYAVTPHLRRVHSYGDAASLLGDPRTLLIFSVLSATPFAVLAIVALVHLRDSGALLLRQRWSGLAAAFLALFILGWWCYAPDTAPGVNFGTVFFPLYAAVAAPIAYALGRLGAALAAGR